MLERKHYNNITTSKCYKILFKLHIAKVTTITSELEETKQKEMTGRVPTHLELEGRSTILEAWKTKLHLLL